MIIQRQLVATYDYDVREKSEPFHFRLEVHQCGEIYTGTVFRLERYRLPTTFPQDAEGVPIGIMDDALLYIKDEFIDDRDLSGATVESIVTCFSAKLQSIFYASNDAGH
ncbi:hypothetical protein HV213_10225 [Klebsiella sp. RHBSTW-00484]|uniref:hypothetical protein n=1 Tax=unclassified Klebsiella TaxID=2608929 RepID=UPI0015E50C03|nr:MULTISPECIES: hypothetical protein [unclassified Klebsiella]QLO36185.1 hypothetical protein HV213_10225 [Klebsiella sp. RHBSTW-00484]QLT75702.1 hypothetical protein HV204_10225 [Klebsiella sp. RHBSTW-00464]